MKAGAAAVQITPLPEHLQGPLYLGGYGGFQSRRASGVHDDLWSRALALAEGSETCVLAALDLVGISHAHLDDIQRRASRATGIPVERILVACTHSHASPDLQGLWGGVPGPYAAHLRTQVVRSITEAMGTLGDVEATVGRSELTGLVRNRRGWDYTDREVTVLRFRRPGGGLVATLVNFACHPTVTTAGNLDISCDFPRYLVDALEKADGGLAMFVNGAEGDANPATSGDFEEARRMGEAAARTVRQALEDAEPLSGPLSLRSRTVHVPLGIARLPPIARLLLTRGGPLLRAAGRSGLLGWLARRSSGGGGSTPGQGAQILAAVTMISEQGVVARGGRPHLPTRVATLEIGPSLRGMTAPGEAMTRMGLPLKEALDSPYRLFLGLTYDTLGYLIPADEWMTGRNNNYEESVSVGREASAAIGAALLELMSQGQARP